ncbi:AbrB/MazE/SpoVT family DNA-binding domain-containing protein [Longimicrobium sp.]|uniref:AbrB/MazE/SpoVT family DNA-binding domain-containing protein n=1 Tax=Longimicrobium sp. TaxID=2029185 RepID=UPI002E2F8609|nr:AbrB/MazE/SpoVT family DNA-binding domain-containing protein [Longimicrobium sp.]HEX6038126.1 AbrB/MazE/SpoVT family DNA-binding domain-containing protein [Longimicrobium sp.]
MVREIRVRRSGSSVTVTLPKDMMDRLRVEAGDKLFAIETEHGVLLTPCDPRFEPAMQAFEEVRGRYRTTLRKLAD